MASFSFVLVAIAMAVTLLVLLSGLVVFARGGETNRKYGNKLMQARVAAQAVAVLLFVIAMLLRDG